MNAKEMFETIYKEAMAAHCFNDALRAADELYRIEQKDEAKALKEETERDL